VRRRRGLVVSLVLVVVGGTGLLLAASRTWWTVTVHSAGLPATTQTLTGRQAAPATVGLGVLGLAAAAGVLATAGWWRRLIDGIVLVAGTAAAVSAWSLLAASGWQRAIGWEAASGSVVALRSAWPLIAMGAGVVMAVGGGLGIGYGHHWPGWSARYDGGGAAAATPTPASSASAPHELWDALDRGEDPTASPDVAAAPDLPE